MTGDDELAEARARVKDFDLGPVPDVDLGALVRRGHRRRRRLVAQRVVAVAAGLMLVVGLGVGVAQVGRRPDTAGVPTPTPTGRPADCRAVDITPSLDSGRTGAAAGTEQVVLLFVNTGSRPCWLGGFPALFGEASDGATTRLPFRTSSDPAVADPSPAGGPGSVDPGRAGALHLTLQTSDCAATAPHFTRLHITLAAGQTLTMAFPAELQLTACWGNEASIGPVVDGVVPTTGASSS